MWGVFSLPGHHNNDKKRDLLLHKSIFPLECVKLHVKIQHKSSKSDKYVVQNLTWSGAYLRSTFSYAIIQKILKLVPLTATRPEVYVATIITSLSGSNYSLVETLTHIKSLKLKDHTGGNVAWQMLSALIVPESLITSTSDISFVSLRILMILDSIHGRLRSTRSLFGLLRNFVCVTNISCNLMRELLMVPLFDKICVNIETLFTKSDGNPLIVRKRLKMSLYL